MKKKIKKNIDLKIKGTKFDTKEKNNKEWN
jgi:hypothetical protein